jgi:hypothetical protein
LELDCIARDIYVLSRLQRLELITAKVGNGFGNLDKFVGFGMSGNKDGCDDLIGNHFDLIGTKFIHIVPDGLRNRLRGLTRAKGEDGHCHEAEQRFTNGPGVETHHK